MTIINDGKTLRRVPDESDHLYDSHKPYHAKDDVRQLHYLLDRLKKLGGDYNFNDDYETNSANRMRCTLHSGRKRNQNNKAYSAKHNDRNFDSEPEHIEKEQSQNNITWSWCGNEISFDEGELKYYEYAFGEQLEQTNQNYINNRHKERCKTMDEWRKEILHAPEEQILQIGKMEQFPEPEVSLECFKEYMEWLNDWNNSHGNPFFILNWAMHVDEKGAPHFQLRRTWPYEDPETGLVTTDQTNSLLKAGVTPPYPGRKLSQKNNPKITFDKLCRSQWISIARSHGLDIEDTPKPKNKVGKDLVRFQKEKDDERNEIYRLLVEMTERSIGSLEKVSEWEEEEERKREIALAKKRRSMGMEY